MWCSCRDNTICSINTTLVFGICIIVVVSFAAMIKTNVELTFEYLSTIFFTSRLDQHWWTNLLDLISQGRKVCDDFRNETWHVVIQKWNLVSGRKEKHRHIEGRGRNFLLLGRGASRDENPSVDNYVSQML
jgi:hypothetical protein